MQQPREGIGNQERSTKGMQEASRVERAKQEQKELVNAGEAPLAARFSTGDTRREEFCEDMIINDPEHGLFMIADGVSGSRGKTGAGAFASRETAIAVQTHVGEELDKEIANLLKVVNVIPYELEQMIDRLVEFRMRNALGEADQRIVRLRESDSDKHAEAATTVTLAKEILLPGENEPTLYLLNIGDSRAFLYRDERLRRLTIDDSFGSEEIQKAVGLDKTSRDSREVVEQKRERFDELLRQLDQATDSEDLPPILRAAYPFRNILTRSLGDGDSFRRAKVKKIKLKKGDRVILASDGLTENLSEFDIQKMLSGTENDREAQRELQNAADQADRKADDIAALVRTIGAHSGERASRETVHEQAKTTPEFVATEADVQAWTMQLRAVDAEILAITARLRQEKDPETKRDLDLQMVDQQIAQATLEYWLSRVEKDHITRDLPERFGRGEVVRLPLKFKEETNPAQIQNWEVGSYNEATEQYVVSKGDESMSIDRFELEFAQGAVSVKPGDALRVRIAENVYQEGWKVTDVDGGSVIVHNNIDGKEQNKMILVERASHAAKNSIGRAYDLRTRMEKSLERLQAVEEKKQKLLLEKQQASERSARDKALGIARI